MHRNLFAVQEHGFSNYRSCTHLKPKLKTILKQKKNIVNSNRIVRLVFGVERRRKKRKAHTHAQLTRLDDVAIGEDNTAALVDDEAGGVAGGGGLCIEGTSGGGSEYDDGGDDSVEGFPPVLGGCNVFLEWRIDFHAQLIGLDGSASVQTLRSQPLLRWISHFLPTKKVNALLLFVFLHFLSVVFSD